MLTAVLITLGVILIILIFILFYGVYYAIETIEKLESIRVSVKGINNSIDILNNKVDNHLGYICNSVHQINNRL